MPHGRGNATTISLKSSYVSIFEIIHCRIIYPLQNNPLKFPRLHVGEIFTFTNLHECVGDGDAIQKKSFNNLAVVINRSRSATDRRFDSSLSSSVSVAVPVVALDTVAIESESLFIGRCFSVAVFSESRFDTDTSFNIRVVIWTDVNDL